MQLKARATHASGYTNPGTALSLRQSKRAIRMDSPLLRRWLRKQRSGSIRCTGEPVTLIPPEPCSRAQHLFANFLVLLGLRTTGWQSNVEQLLNGLDIMHVQALKLLRRQVFLDVLAIIGRQNNICHSRAFCRQRLFLDAADGK